MQMPENLENPLEIEGGNGLKEFADYSEEMEIAGDWTPGQVQFGASESVEQSEIIDDEYSMENIKRVTANPAKHCVKSEFHENDGSSKFTIIPMLSKVQASYQWEIPESEFKSTEKLVSLPFGPSNWNWQVV
jgi:hypothetical protein